MRLPALMRRAMRSAEQLLQVYAAVLFSPRPLAGLVLLVATFLQPEVGGAGLITLLLGAAMMHLLRLRSVDDTAALYNSLLAGLALGALFGFDAALAVALPLAALLAVATTPILGSALRRWEALPPLSLPFVPVVWVIALAAWHLTLPSATAAFPALSSYPGIDAFLTALGALFFTPDARAGVLVLVALVLTSPWLALLAAIGFVAGDTLSRLLNDGATASVYAGFNSILASLATGGVFVVPGREALLLAAIAAALAALFTAALQTLLAPVALPPLALPFLAATFLLLAAMRHRVPLARPWLLLTRPDLPERSFERSAMTRARDGDPDSTPLAPPFLGAWTIYQGFDDRHTHQGPWRHALDFFVAMDGRSFTGTGNEPLDYLCFDLPVRSPAAGWVTSVRDDLPDQRPGQVDLANNWGNHVMLRLVTGRYVLLAHLRQGSVKVKAGEWVEVGAELARCGSSGRSPQPHLHLQVQSGPELGAPTLPFHLTSVFLLQKGVPRYCTTLRPARGDTVQGAARDPRLARALHLPVGRELRFRLDDGELAQGRVTLGIDGLRRLEGRGDARVGLIEYPGVLAAFDREGGADPLLDLWLFALGLTPLAEGRLAWHDALPARLLPLPLWQRALLRLRHPLGALTRSEFRREWDANAAGWRQVGHHRVRCGPWQIEARSEAFIDPEEGVTRISLRCGRRHRSADLVARGLASDDGIPGWSRPLPSAQGRRA